jgi:hypothetical protein
MVYVPVEFMARFINTNLTDHALDKQFGTREKRGGGAPAGRPGVTERGVAG